MFDSIFEIGSAFDWISPLGALIGNALNGPSHTFLISCDSSPLTGRDIAKLLKRRGIDSWGHMVVQGTIMITIQKRQARFAQHLLDEAGVVTEAAPDEKEEAYELRWPAFETFEELQKWWEAQ